MADTENVTFRGVILGIFWHWDSSFAVEAGSMEALTVARKFTLVLF